MAWRGAAAAACAAMLAVASLRAGAGGGPENVLLVVNAESPDSGVVAAEYVRLRRIPASNVLRLSGVPKGGVIKVDDFRRLILQPVLAAIRLRGLARQIDYVVYSAGFPYAVDVSSDVAGRPLPRVITQPASLTGLTYMAPLVMAKDIGYLALDANWYARRPRTARAEGPWPEADMRRQREMEALVVGYQEQRRAVGAGRPDTPEMVALVVQAATLGRALAAAHPANPDVLYNLACCQALLGKPAEAVATLGAACRAGWWNASLTATDPDLVSLRGRRDFQAVLERMRATPVQMQAPRPFHAAQGWQPDGQPIAPGSGRRYLLSAMLGYVGGPANTLEEVLASLRRSRAADGSAPRGTIYFMESTDQARTGPRAWAFRSAADALHRLGVRAEVLPGVLPPARPDVAGAMVGIANFDWKKSGSTILPGAFCDHLTSAGGVMTGGGQTLLSEFIRGGAAGACGTVTEPYNTPTKFPTAFVQVFYASGCSLAEAFYQSVTGPYQQLLVGDPLCQPWAKAPVVRAKGLAPGAPVVGIRRLTPSAASALPVHRYELYVDGRLRGSCAPGQTLSLDARSLALGPHEARVVAVAGPLETRGRLVLPFRCSRGAHR